jgi:hypothetical protein
MYYCCKPAGLIAPSTSQNKSRLDDGNLCSLSNHGIIFLVDTEAINFYNMHVAYLCIKTMRGKKNWEKSVSFDFYFRLWKKI